VAVVQASLFDTGAEPAPGALSGDLRRIALSDGAWVDHLPAWMGRADLLVERLERAVPWRAERRTMYDRVVDVPRPVAFYGTGEALPEPALEVAREALATYYRGTPGADLATTGLCLYRDGGDSVAWHGDTLGRGATEDTLVAILSLGERRRLLLRRRGGGAPTERFELGGGDLIVMGGSCQRTWEHSVPKTTRATGPRISVQFRPVGVR
jgi:alkylated DNA repair dioxygenase AlkB